MNRALHLKPNDDTQACLGDSRQDPVALLLVGGLGTRLRSVVSSLPKPLAPLGDKSFLQLLVEQLRSQGIRNLVMCTGYSADRIAEEFGDGHEWGVTIQYSRELYPLGTAGAVKLAERHLSRVPDFLVMNGDSFLEIDIADFIRFHRATGGLISIAVHMVKNATRYGAVQVDAANRVIGFTEKTEFSAPRLINAGMYIFNRTVLRHIPDRPGSLERDVFPRILEHGIYALEQHGMFIDIGTPDDYARAQTLYHQLCRVAAFRNQGTNNPHQSF